MAPHPFGPRVFICSGKIKCNCHKNTKTFLHFVNLFIFSSSRKRKHKDAEMIRVLMGAQAEKSRAGGTSAPVVAGQRRGNQK